jgi:hypothetical protein
MVGRRLRALTAFGPRSASPAMPAEGMSLVDAYVSAAMILSGMGPLWQLHTSAGKIFAGSYAIFSGLVIVIAASFVLAPIFHRVLHRFHVERQQQD